MSDALGKVVRQAWVEWAKEQRLPKPTWTVPYEELPATDQDVDRRIGVAVAKALWAGLNDRRIALCEKKSVGPLSGAEAIEFGVLQREFFAMLEIAFPGPPSIAPQLDAIEKRLTEGGEQS